MIGSLPLKTVQKRFYEKERKWGCVVVSVRFKSYVEYCYGLLEEPYKKQSKHTQPK